MMKQEFLKKWIKGLETYSRQSKKMSILERKKAIKLSADVAMASTRNASTRWSKALIAHAISTNRVVVERILEKKPSIMTMMMMKCSKRVLRRSRKGVVPRSRRCLKASSVAKKLVRNRTRVLKRLVPGGQEIMDQFSLIRETLDYIVSLRLQVQVMRQLAQRFDPA